jgi:hypothetical protein
MDTAVAIAVDPPPYILVLVDYDVNLGPLGIIFGSYGMRVAIDGVAPGIVPSHARAGVADEVRILRRAGVDHAVANLVDDEVCCRRRLDTNKIYLN